MLALSIRVYRCTPCSVPRRTPCSVPRRTPCSVPRRMPCSVPRRLCSGGPAVQSSTVYSRGKAWVEGTLFFKFINNPYVARLLRVSRVLALCYGVYFIGEKDGMAKYALDDKGLQRELREQLVYSFSKSKIMTQKDNNYHKFHDRALKISRRLIHATHEEFESAFKALKAELRVVNEQLKCSKEKVKRLKMIVELTAAQREELKKEEELSRQLQSKAEALPNSIAELTVLLNTMFRGHQWSIFVTDSAVPNAYVSNMCPRSIFIHAGLLQQASDDEVALVVGHEMAHLMLHHTEKRSQWAFRLSTITMIIMVLVDPTGFYSNLFDNALLRLSSFVQRRIGHDQENEADELGVYLAHAACYNVHKGRLFLRKIERWTDKALPQEKKRYAAALAEERQRQGFGAAGMLDTHTTMGAAAAVYDAGWNQTHPSHDFREDHINAVIKKLPPNTHCGSVKFQLQRASEYLQRMQHYHS